MKLVGVILVLLFSVNALAAPVVNKGQIVGFISQEMRDTPLMWSPFPIPYEISTSSKDKDALLLEALMRHDLVVREEFLQTVEYQQDGRLRRSVSPMWRYTYAKPNPMVDEQEVEGFYYGYGRLIRLLDISEPTVLDDEYYIAVKVEWAVADLQSWVKDPAFLTARTLRRSLESAKKPFEKTVYLRHDGKQWRVWKEEQ